MDKQIHHAQKNPKKRDPEATRQRILLAAQNEFAKRGFDGARIDTIADQAQVNKQMIYHYFGSKDQLFTIVLENAYKDLREKESQLDLSIYPAHIAVLRLVDFSWQYYLDNPYFIRLLNSENQLEAIHLKNSPNTKTINQSHNLILASIIERGKREGNIRRDIDPVQLNISIAALGFFYLLNRFTLSCVYERDLAAPEALEKRRLAMRETIARWIAP